MAVNQWSVGDVDRRPQHSRLELTDSAMFDRYDTNTKRKTESITQHSGMTIMQYCTAKPTTYERIATVITCITSVILSFIVVYTCANVICIKNLRSYLLTYLLTYLVIDES